MSRGANITWTAGLALTYGILWGVIVAIIVAVALALATGLEVRPNLAAGTLAGGATALACGFWPILSRSWGFVFGLGLLAILVVVASSWAAPFTLPLSEAGGAQAIALLGFGLGLTWVLTASLKKIEPRDLNRYRIEGSMLVAIRAFGFVVFIAMVLLPFYVMVMTSFKSQQALIANPLDFSIDFSQGIEQLFRSYIELFRDFNFGRYMWVSTIVSLATVAITLMFAIPGAYAVARLRFAGRSAMSRSILLVYMVPAIVLVIPLYALFSQLGLRNSLIGLLIVYPATTLPVALYMLQGYFRGLPVELEEAGQMDGYSRLAVIWHITLPLSLPAIATVALYVFMIAWNEFLFAFMFLDDTDKFTLSRGVVSLNSSEVPRQHLMAGAVVATIPILVIFLWAERFLVKGLTAGGVKG